MKPWIVCVWILLIGAVGFLGIAAFYYAEKAKVHEHESVEFQRMLKKCSDSL